MRSSGWPYRTDGRQVFFGTEPIAGADPSTFEAFYATWARDARRAYCQSSALRKADAASFVALSKIAAKDKNHVFELGGIVNDADAASYEVLPPSTEPLDECSLSEYSRDREHVFYKVQTIRQGAHREGAEPASFTSIDGSFAKDRNKVYYDGYQLKTCRAASWEHLGACYSRDDRSVYYGNTKIDDADRATIAVLPSASRRARDARQHYQNGRREEPHLFWAELRELTVLTGAIIHGEVIDHDRNVLDSPVTYGNAGGRFVVRCDVILQGNGLEPRDTFDFVAFAQSHMRPAAWVGRDRVWFCTRRDCTLRPFMNWQTFWPIERRAEVDALLAELSSHAS